LFHVRRSAKSCFFSGIAPSFIESPTDLRLFSLVLLGFFFRFFSFAERMVFASKNCEFF